MEYEATGTEMRIYDLRSTVYELARCVAADVPFTKSQRNRDWSADEDPSVIPIPFLNPLSVTLSLTPRFSEVLERCQRTRTASAVFQNLQTRS